MIDIDDGSKVRKKCFKAYMSRSNLDEIFNKFVRQKVERRI